MVLPDAAKGSPTAKKTMLKPLEKKGEMRAASAFLKNPNHTKSSPEPKYDLRKRHLCMGDAGGELGKALSDGAFFWETMLFG